MPANECAVCLQEHDEEIHAATLRLHAWIRETVRRAIDDLLLEDPDAA